MKKIMILIVLILLLIVNCSYFEGAERAEKERGRRCRYNYKGELQHCGYIN
ncbi:hypothetical protein [Leptotrichia sp. oral taxon 879]|uniref:hypothetical protein n=1 Tax=Leptotrichia sp. oral taxon 879 TaxID=1227267 RepID=UPI0003AE6B07|nr:hypothetical protein [Leptotrichia sp. oral taxon 879]ERK47429.1 hypothetical protein HMPREF1552_02426 [Leptotrichia sp. oral taxon 879 str. F0557]